MVEITKYEERRLILPMHGKVTSVKVLSDGSSIEVVYQVPLRVMQKDIEDFFPIVRASELPLWQGILAYTPQTEKQKVFKNRLEKAIASGLHDFRAQCRHPVYDGKSNRLLYSDSREWDPSLTLFQWETLAKEVNPSKNSRLGMATEKIAFLGYIIKLLTEKHNYSLSKAWYAVCDDSGGIAYFAHGQDRYLEPIGPFSHLGNGYSITKNDLGESDCPFAFIGGHPYDDGKYRPLANVIFTDYRGTPTYTEDSATGFIVSDV